MTCGRHPLHFLQRVALVPDTSGRRYRPTACFYQLKCELYIYFYYILINLPGFMLCGACFVFFHHLTRHGLNASGELPADVVPTVERHVDSGPAGP